MKIIVITKHYVKNYGSVLQTYATQELLKRNKNEVIIANYVLPQSAGMRYMDVVLRKHTSRLKRGIFKIILLPTMLRWEKVFGGFLKKYVNVYGDPAGDCAALERELPEADLYCTGSDQVWNPQTNGDLQPPYFCEFAKEGKERVSFAASFGVKQVDEKYEAALKSYLEKYSALSVRETSGVRMIERMGMQAVEILDPVFAAGSEFWARFAGKRKIKKSYVLVYQLNSSKKFDSYAKWASEKLGKQLVRICTRYDQIVKNGKSVLIPSVEEWISLFYYADYVITDSFHGTVFSLLFEKEFVSIYPPKFSERIENLLSMVKLEDRHVAEDDRLELPKNKIDYKEVNKILENERQKTNEFIDLILKDK